MFEHKVIFETYCLTTVLIWGKKKLCMIKKCVKKIVASKPRCQKSLALKPNVRTKLLLRNQNVFFKNLASKLKCLNISLILKPNVWTKLLFQTKMFFKKSCYEVQMSEYLQVLLWNQMLEQKSCFKTKMFEQRSFNETKMFTQ